MPALTTHISFKLAQKAAVYDHHAASNGQLVLPTLPPAPLIQAYSDYDASEVPSFKAPELRRLGQG